MITIELLLSRILFVAVFTGGFLIMVSGISQKYSPFLSVTCLAVLLLCTYLVHDSSFIWSMVRYLVFSVVYFIWCLVFLRIRPRYALYLSGFFVILMGVWLGIIQTIFTFLNIQNTILMILCNGLCRLGSVILLRRYFILISPDRDITVQEILLSLFPAFTCFIANQVLYEFVRQEQAALPESWRLPISLLVLFFGVSAILVLAHSERYFKLNVLKTENELATRQLENQYQLFLKEKESTEQVKAMRHDIQNHLHTIEKMAVANDAGTIRNYVSDLQKAAEKTEQISSTGNTTLDALLAAKMPVLEKRKIRLDNYLNLKDISLFTPMEICTLFGNAIDNAIEAVSNENINDRYIHLSGGLIHDHLIVKIENPYYHTLLPEKNRFHSTKRESGSHGYGLLNIEKTIADHQGTVTYKTGHQLFSMVWMIPVEI